MWKQRLNIKEFVLSKNVGKLALINVVLALVAFLKDTVFAAYFGTSRTADLFTLAFFLPDTIGNNLLGSALSVACIPVFSALVAKGKYDRLNNLVRTITLHMAMASGGLVLFIFYSKHSIYQWFAEGLDVTDMQRLESFVVILLPSLIMFSIVTIFIALLQANEKFAGPAWAPVFFNGMFLLVVFILLVAKININLGGTLTVIGVSIASLIMFGYVLILLIPVYQPYTKILKIYGNIIHLNFPKLTYQKVSYLDTYKIYQILIPYLIILLSMQAVYGIERQIASTMSVGMVAALNYAFRLSQFPNWVFVSAITTVILPRMIKIRMTGDDKQFRQVFYQGIRDILLIAVPVSLIIFFFRQPLLWILFKHGAFDQQSLVLTASILKGYSLSIIGQSISALFLRYFISFGLLYIPMGITIVSSLSNIYFDYHWNYYFLASTFGYGAILASVLNGIGMGGYFCYLQCKHSFTGRSVI